jgi:hypothetical protein
MNIKIKHGNNGLKIKSKLSGNGINVKGTGHFDSEGRPIFKNDSNYFKDGSGVNELSSRLSNISLKNSRKNNIKFII